MFLRMVGEYGPNGRKGKVKGYQRAGNCHSTHKVRDALDDIWPLYLYLRKPRILK